MEELTFRVLSERWWVRWRQRAPVEAALTSAFLQHWTPVVERALRGHAERGERPADWLTLHNLLGGQDDVRFLSSPLGLAVLSTTLGVEVDTLLPDTKNWLTSAIIHLGQEAIAEADARAFVDFQFGAFKNDQLDRKSVQLQLESLEESQRRPILSAAKRLGEPLAPLFESDEHRDGN